MKKGQILIITGFVLIAAAFCLIGYNQWTGYKAGQEADAVLAELGPMIRDDAPPATGRKVSDDPTEIEYPDYVLNPDMDMPVKELDGYKYVGTLDIQDLGILLPVMNEWNYPNLRIAPCRFTGTPYKNNFVICAHNYDRHFGQIKNLRYGAPVAFTDMDGNRFLYEVTEIEDLKSTDVKWMTESDADLTLFTCTLGGASRIAVRCYRQSDFYFPGRIK